MIYCLDNISYSYNGQHNQQCHGCTIGSPVLSIVSNLYVEQLEHLAPSAYLYTGLQSWNRYVDGTFEALHSDENVKKTCHINAVDPNIKFTEVNISDNRLSLLDYLVTIYTDRTLSVTVF